tara:strand:- start:199 stop:519 length:321 start_codon:yes stop_codon:yes gene_type:complete
VIADVANAGETDNRVDVVVSGGDDDGDALLDDRVDGAVESGRKRSAEGHGEDGALLHALCGGIVGCYEIRVSACIEVLGEKRREEGKEMGAGDMYIPHCMPAMRSA